MFRSRKHKSKHHEKKHSSKSFKHSAGSSISSSTAAVIEPFFHDERHSIHEPQAQWTKHISRSLLSLPLSSTSARQSLSPSSDVLHTFTFDLPPPPPRSMSYTSSPISPVAPILPPIPRVSDTDFINDEYKAEDQTLSRAADIWTQSVAPVDIRQPSLDGTEQASISDSARISLPLQITTSITEASDNVAHDRSSDNIVRKSEKRNDTQQWPLTSSVPMDSRGRPQTAPREQTNISGVPNGRPRMEGRFNSEGGTSPILSRPMTAGPSHRAFARSPDGTIHSDGSNPTSNTTNLPPLGQSINMLGSTSRTIPSSPSNLPSDSHRFPPKPPSSSSSRSIGPSFTNSIHTSRQTSTAPVYTPPVPTTKKNKLSLLNPVSLLLRRRAHRSVPALSQDSLTTTSKSSQSFPALPHDFDPRIRGKIVHDFSTPKDRRADVISPQSFRSGASAERDTRDGQLLERERTPAFTEHFEETGANAAAAVRAEQLENKQFLARNSTIEELDVVPAPPPFGRPKGFSNPPAIPLTIDTTFATLQPPPAQDSLSLSPVAEEATSMMQTKAVAVAPMMSTESTPKRQSAIHRRTTTAVKKRSRRVSAASRMSRSSVASDASYSATDLPSHSNSRSSRFSFQLAGKDSILQEQMLEERHKQKEAARRQAGAGDPDTQEPEDAEDDYDFDDDMDYMEEDVPTVGDDWGYDDSAAAVGLGNMTLDDTRDASVPNVAQLALKGNPVSTTELPGSDTNVQGLGILRSPEGNFAQSNVAGLRPINDFAPHAGSFDFTDGTLDDDLYFDDGMIDEVNFDQSQRFDESVLDDPSHPLYERRSKQAEDVQTAMPPMPSKHAEGSEDHSAFESNVTVLNFNNPPNTSATPQAMAEYHNILAMAATKAAEAGRFERQDAFATPSSADASTTREGSSQPSLVQEDLQSSRTSQSSPQNVAKVDSAIHLGEPRILQSPDSFVLGSGYDTFESNYMAYPSDLDDYDSALEDDPIIAAANADALANDDDGVYGSEFGFYAKPDTESDGVFQDGGYFGPKEWSDIKRQKSTREPNLTPITERSEFSTRNSFIHLPSTDRDRSQSALGLAQLARMSPHGWDGDMNMEALMKLRKGAFGGSQASLGSHGSGRDAASSPLASSPIGRIQENRIPTGDKLGGVMTSRSNFAMPMVAAGAIADQHSDDDQNWVDASSAEESDYTSTEEVDEDEEDDDDDNDFTYQQTYRNDTVRANMHNLTGVGRNSTLPSSPASIKHNTSSSPLSARSDHSQNRSQSSSSFAQQSLPAHNFVFPGPASSHGPSAHIHTNINTASAAAIAAGGSHSRSGSDSVAYVQEQDAGAAHPHWILERRRTGDNGIEQVVGRTRIENNMI